MSSRKIIKCAHLRNKYTCPSCNDYSLRNRISNRARFNKYMYDMPTKVISKGLGISIPEYRNYLSEKFKDGMTWDNYGKVWEIDHIVPLKNAGRLLEAYELLHYTNTQPLLKTENRKKGCK